jgi:Phosphotransferase enzyme family
VIELWPPLAGSRLSSASRSRSRYGSVGSGSSASRGWTDAGPAGPVIVKARAADDRHDEKTAWAAAALPPLAAHGYPVPQILWHCPFDDHWHLVVLERLPGRPVEVLTDELLALVLDLVELQADAGVDPGVRDMAAYNWFVVFDGWDYFRRDAEAAAPALAGRLDARVTETILAELDAGG